VKSAAAAAPVRLACARTTYGGRALGEALHTCDSPMPYTAEVQQQTRRTEADLDDHTDRSRTLPDVGYHYAVTAAAKADFSRPSSARAMLRMCTSSGPSKIRIARCQP
jgi:hypothetical protein